MSDIIGMPEIPLLGTITLQAVKANHPIECTGCYFEEFGKECYAMKCIAIERSDATSVIFKEVKQDAV